MFELFSSQWVSPLVSEKNWVESGRNWNFVLKFCEHNLIGFPYLFEARLRRNIFGVSGVFACSLLFPVFAQHPNRSAVFLLGKSSTLGLFEIVHLLVPCLENFIELSFRFRLGYYPRLLETFHVLNLWIPLFLLISLIQMFSRCTCFSSLVQIHEDLFGLWSSVCRKLHTWFLSLLRTSTENLLCPCWNIDVHAHGFKIF